MAVAFSVVRNVLLVLGMATAMAPAALAAGKEADQSCLSCHEVLGSPHLEITTPHSQLACAECHTHPLSPAFHAGGKTVEDVEKQRMEILSKDMRLGEEQVFAVSDRCQTCHSAQYKEWAGSAHTMTYADSFLNRAHNRMEHPMDDCLRCHAMFFEGGMARMVAPLDTRGPWTLVNTNAARRLSIPCLACHQNHPQTQPKPLARHAALRPQPTDENASLTGFYDHRERLFFPLAELPHPKIQDGGKMLKITSDVRVRNCYQCHAPSAAHHAGTGDDKTLTGVHAGLSCLDCHPAHSLAPWNSCAKCHPKMSHCKLDVARMDTTYRSKSSAHDVHTVACVDCHPQGPPKP